MTSINEAIAAHAKKPETVQEVLDYFERRGIRTLEEITFKVSTASLSEANISVSGISLIAALAKDRVLELMNS